MRFCVVVLSFFCVYNTAFSQTTWTVVNVRASPGERTVAIIDAGSIGAYSAIEIQGQVFDDNSNWGTNLPTISNFKTYIRFTTPTAAGLVQERKTSNVILRLRQTSPTVYHLTANCIVPNTSMTIKYERLANATGEVSLAAGDPLIIDSSGTLVIAEPVYELGSHDNGVALNTFNQTNGGLNVASTIGKDLLTGPQLEFRLVKGKNNDGADVFGGMARLIALPTNATIGDLTGKLILGTRRNFNKLGTGNNWYYGDDISIDETGNVGIGITNPSQKFHVNGNILTAGKVYIGNNNGINISNTANYALAVNGPGLFTKIVVKNYNNWPDYVFDSAYALPTLESVSKFVKQNKHLPELPTATEVENKGQDLAEVQKVLVKKVEELTLYIIQLKQENNDMRQENKEIRKRLAEVEKTK